MKYALADLLRVRCFRKDQASTEVQKRQRALETAIAEVQSREKTLADYHLWRIDREQQMFAEIAATKVKVHDLDSYRENVSLLREKELQLHAEIDEARRAQKTAETDLETARGAYRKASQETQKIEEHKKIWLEAVAKEQERLQDLELEEFHAKQNSLDEDEHDEDQHEYQ